MQQQQQQQQKQLDIWKASPVAPIKTNRLYKI